MSRIEQAKQLADGELLEEIAGEIRLELFQVFCESVDIDAKIVRDQMEGLNLVIGRIRYHANATIENKEVRDDNR